MDDEKIRLYSNKKKEDLLDIVRLTNVIPIGKASRMKKQELVDLLIELEKNGEEMSSLDESNNNFTDLVSDKNKSNKKESKSSRKSETELTNETADKDTEIISEDTEIDEEKLLKVEGNNRKSNTNRKSSRGKKSKENNDEEIVSEKKTRRRTKSKVRKSDASLKDSVNSIGLDEENEAKEIVEANEVSNIEPSENEYIAIEQSVNSFDNNNEIPAQETTEVSTEENKQIADDELKKEKNNRQNRRHKQNRKSRKNKSKNENKQNEKDDVNSSNVNLGSDADSDVLETNIDSPEPEDDKEISSDIEVKVRDKQELASGILEVLPDGFGFLRRDNYIQGPNDIYVPPQIIRKLQLRPGDEVKGVIRKQRDNDKYQALSFVQTVNGMEAESVKNRPHFGRLTPIYPSERFRIETGQKELAGRIIDLVSPIGKGQRAMIVSPPKAGKTILLQKIANAISVNNPEAKLIVLLIDERPEEVTDMQRSIKGEVAYSTFDKMQENHVKITELVLERAKRLVELGQDVVILLDSMTRLARAYNLSITPTGRTLSGGLDPGALYGPKRFFGAARKIENGGSLTIIATSLIETGSRMDEVIFEEFKGTGNMEVILDRKMSEKRIFPAIDIVKSGTRREDLLLSKEELEAIWCVRKTFSNMEPINVTEIMHSLLLKTKNNRLFTSTVNMSLGEKNILNAFKEKVLNDKKERSDFDSISENYSNGIN